MIIHRWIITILALLLIPTTLHADYFWRNLEDRLLREGEGIEDRYNNTPVNPVGVMNLDGYIRDNDIAGQLIGFWKKAALQTNNKTLSSYVCLIDNNYSWYDHCVGRVVLQGYIDQTPQGNWSEDGLLRWLNAMHKGQLDLVEMCIINMLDSSPYEIFTLKNMVP